MKDDVLMFPLTSGLWAVVNNAGISEWSEIEWSTIEDFRNMVDINLFGSIRTSIAFLPLVRASKGESSTRLPCSGVVARSLRRTLS